MAEKSSSTVNPLDSLERSQSSVSIQSNVSTATSRRSTASSLFSSASSRRRHGLLGKIGNGFQTVFRRLSRFHTALTEIDLKILQTLTNFSREEILQWHENFLRECPQGYMTRKQFIAMYKSLAPKSDAERFARHVFRALDLDKSNTIDFREFLLSASMTSSTSTPEMKLQWSFHVFDIDGNGLLTRRECLEVIEAIVRFQYATQVDHQQINVEQLIHNAKRSMMRIFDQCQNSHSDGLTMPQFVQGCLKDPFISQLLAPPSPTSTTTTTTDVTSNNASD